MNPLQRLRGIVLCLSICAFVADAASFIKFPDPDGDRTEFPDRKVIADHKRFHWTANWPTDIRLEFIRAVPLSLYLQCHTEVLSVGEELTEAAFCFENQQPPLNMCVVLKPSLRSANISLGAAPVLFTFDPRRGVVAALEAVPASVQLPLFAASCRLGNRRGTVRSNRLFLVDLRTYFPPVVNISDDLMLLSSNDPSTLPCLSEGLSIARYLPHTYQPAVPLAFAWEVCDSPVAQRCVRQKNRRSVFNLTFFDRWPIQIRADGALYIPFVPNDVFDQLQNKYLMCSLFHAPITFFAEPVNITEEYVIPSSPGPLSALPEVRNVTLWNTKGFVLQLPCWVDTSAPLDSVTWRFQAQGSTQAKVLTSNNAKAEVTIAEDGHSLTFSGDFSSAIEGRYTCEARLEAQAAVSSSSFQVVVRKPPSVGASVRSEALVVSGKRLAVTCSFEDPRGVTPGLEVCGQPLDLSSWTSLRRSRAALAANCRGFNVSGVRPAAGQAITYQLRAFRRKKAAAAEEKKKEMLIEEEKSHQVTCVGDAPPFRVRKTVLVKVLRPPSVEVNAWPNECFADCKLRCAVRDVASYARLGVKVELRWNYGGVGKNDTKWSQWKSSESSDVWLAEDASVLQQCEVRLVRATTREVLFKGAIRRGDVVKEAEADPAEEEVEEVSLANRLPVVITAGVFAVIVGASLIYFLVYRWQHRVRQSA